MSRTSRWDRPPGPRDIRWFVRLVGKTLIIVGLLMFGFVGYQLWGTGIEYARAQDRLEGEFAELMAAAANAPTTSAATTTTAPATTSEPGTSTSTTAASSTTASTTTSTTVPVFDIASLGITDGQGFGRMEIPRIGLDDIVVAGVSREDLKEGPGHYPQTPMPGQLGNSAIAGHRTTYGAPFLHVDDIEPGDEIIVTTPYGRFVYLMTSTEIVSPDNWEVIRTTDPTIATLTLTSCHPIGTARDRIIVHAELDLAQSDVPGQPVYNYGRDAPPAGTAATLPGEEIATTESATTSTSTSTSSTSIATEPTDSLYSVVPGGGATGGGGAATESEDAFSNHWFTDKEAWPQVALWGGAAIAVVVAAYRLAKQFRNSWIGLATGLAPFFVALYFFYQNVNRLLPSAL